jgi:primase-polymerase (primpol)-like protein
MTVNADAIPSALRSYPQWVCWRAQERNGKLKKVPIDPQTRSFASISDPDTWTHFELAAGVANIEDGLGFVFTDDDPFLGVDLDDCRKDSELTDWATDIVDRLDSYTTISPSGTGVHVLIEGEIPSTKSRKDSVECYDSNRFFTMTGNRLPELPATIESRQDAFAPVYDEYVYRDETPPAESTSERGKDSKANALADAELLEKAKHAKNGEKFTRLWNGTTLGYDSHSEADMALCCLLAFWTGNDPTRIDRLFRDSGLHRDKWGEKHYQDGSTYGEKTVARSIRITDDTYQPDEETSHHVSTQTAGSDPTHVGSTTVLREHVEVLADRVGELETRLAELEAQNDHQISTAPNSSPQGRNPNEQQPPVVETTWRSSVITFLKRLFR